MSYYRLDVGCLDSVELSLRRHSLQAVVAARIIDLVAPVRLVDVGYQNA